MVDLKTIRSCQSEKIVRSRQVNTKKKRRIEIFADDRTDECGGEEGTYIEWFAIQTK